MKILDQIEKRLSVMSGFENPHSAKDFVVPNKEKNCLLIKEENQNAEIAIYLSEAILGRFKAAEFPRDFSLEAFPDLSVLVEELSHFNFYCAKAIEDQTVSALEMEVQAEMDKFIFALDCLEEINQKNLEHQLFEQLFETSSVGEWVGFSDKERYEEANRITKNLCGRLLRQDLNTAARQNFSQEFFKAPMSKKLAPFNE